MTIYRDFSTNEPLLSSNYDFKTINNILYEGKCLKIDDHENHDDDIDQFKLVKDFKLQKQIFTEEQFGIEIFEHIRRIQQHLWENDCSIEESDGFMDNAISYMSDVQKNLEGWQFYRGESKSKEGMLVLVNINADEPYFIILKDGLYEDDDEDDDEEEDTDDDDDEY